MRSIARKDLQNQLRVAQEAHSDELNALRDSIKGIEKAHTEALLKAERNHSTAMQEMAAKLSASEAELRMLRNLQTPMNSEQR